jgi:hypothetical protein
MLNRATGQDYRTEHLGLIINVKVVNGLEAAINHIETFGSHHSDAIITSDESVAKQFLSNRQRLRLLECEHSIYRMAVNLALEPRWALVPTDFMPEDLWGYAN